jgi:2-oxoglutarate dehydrogenase E2 component (dihydrolipoamide succinyltransferase)
LSPAVRKLVEEHDLDPSQIEGTGKGGRLTKADVLDHLESADGQSTDAAETTPEAPEPQPQPTTSTPAPSSASEDEEIRREPMSGLRQRVAERLVQAQQEAAILTTFNDVDMSHVMEMRKQYRDSFEQRYGVRLGFMSFFAKACVLALDEIPELNASVDGTDIVYHKHVHMGIAVSTDRGLLVPIIKYADTLKFHELEAKIGELAQKARDKKITPDELSGGTFSITNGGVFGSLLATPLLNPPQSGILGMHRIEERPVAVNGQVEVRPMMYVALSYDHRIVDGRESVTFLRRVKEYIEDPRRLVIEV